MLINLHMLSDALEKWNFRGHLYDSYGVRTCAYPKICTNTPSQFREDILYLLHSNVLPETPSFEQRVSILCIGKPGKAWLQADFNILYTTEEVSLMALMNEVAFQFFRYQQWEASLQAVIDDGLPIKELAIRTEGVVYNPIYALGSSLHVICGNLPSVEEESALYTEYKESFPLDEGYIADIESNFEYVSDTEFNKLTESKHPTITDDTLLGIRVLYYNLFIEGQSTAMVCIDEVLAPLTQRDYALIEIWGSYVEKKLQTISASLRHTEEMGKILEGLISHKLLPEKKILQFLSDYSWAMFDEYVCIVMKHIIEDTSAALQASAISLANALNHDCYLIKDQTIVFIFNLTRTNQNVDSLSRTLHPMLRDRLLSASVSTVFSDFKNLHYYYKQALETGDIGKKKDPMKWFFNFDDYQLDYLLQKYQERTLPEALIPPGLKRLVEHDRNKNSNYVQTLRVYLDQERNVAATIRILFIHRNTFAYRIERIQELLGINLDRATNRIILQLALQILESNTPEH